jgi:TatD DNase family protein
MVCVDSHCHLQDPAFDADRDAVVGRALDVVEWLVVVGDGLDTSRRAVALTGQRVYATVGCHPYNAASADADGLAALRKLAGHSRVVAIGEIGLDYHYATANPEVQRQAFRNQMDLAIEVGLPVVIHNRDAHADTSALLETYAGRLTGGIMHCFDGDAAFAMQCVDWGLHVSFAGNVTFPKAQRLHEAAQATPIERLLVETDAPYLAPQPVRGKRCEPAFLPHTIQMLAEIKGMAPDILGCRTAENAVRVFGISKTNGS